MPKPKNQPLSEQLKEQRAELELLKRQLAESESKREQEQKKAEEQENKRAREEAEAEAKRAREAEKQAKLREIEANKKRPGGNVNITLTKLYYDKIHELAKRKGGKAATILRRVSEQFLDEIIQNEIEED